jgi:Domain of unknown function (DUF1788)
VNPLNTRLEQLFARLTEEGFLRGYGMGNEVNFHVFDYDPACEPVIERYVPRLVEKLSARGVKALHLNLYDLMLEALQGRGFLERSFALEGVHGGAKLEAALKNVLRSEVIVERIRSHRTTMHDVVIVTGVGAAFPVLRSHTVLNQLHSVVTEPLLMFFPGRYVAMRLELFDAFDDDHYYRAFEIAPRAKFQGVMST